MSHTAHYRGILIVILVGLFLGTSAVRSEAQSGPPANAQQAQSSFESMKALIGKAIADMFTTTPRSGDNAFSLWLKTQTVKGFRVGSCRAPSYAAPTITEPPRSEPAVSLCRQ